MKKVRGNALWNELSAEQLQTLDEWLFEEHLSYAKILPRAQAELGFKGSIGSLKRYSARRQQERVVEKLADWQETAVEVKGTPTDDAAIQAASTKLLGGIVFQKLLEAPE